MARGFDIIVGDSREKLRAVESGSIATVITSPPYAHLKDYGVVEQVGFGEDFSTDYLESIHKIFRECYRILSHGGAFWLISDGFRKERRLVPLPWLLAEVAMQVGFRLEDEIVWDKGRSLPWSHKGSFRSLSERILLFSKGGIKNFFVDNVRETEELSPYWIRYPERYHPYGSAPSDIWHFPIPIQGSWAKGTPRHLCPFPPKLVERMILLTTRAGETVIDPFAGSGSVPIVAAFHHRKGIGVELNRKYARLAKEVTEKYVRDELRKDPINVSADAVKRKLIPKLRCQKFCKVLVQQYTELDDKLARDNRILCIISDSHSFSYEKSQPHVWATMRVTVLLNGSALSAAKSRLKWLIRRPPLSKFGIACTFSVMKSRRNLARRISEIHHANNCMYLYRLNRVYQFLRKLDGRVRGRAQLDWLDPDSILLVSTVKLNISLNEN